MFSSLGFVNGKNLRFRGVLLCSDNPKGVKLHYYFIITCACICVGNRPLICLPSNTKNHTSRKRFFFCKIDIWLYNMC